MGAPQHLTSLSCELRIIRGKNIFKSNGHLFVRCHLPAGNNNRARLDSHEISTKSDLFWNELLSLECLGTKESKEMLMQASVVFELRWRSTVPFLGKIGGSHLLGRAEVPWKTVFESPEMEIEKWVIMAPKNRRANEEIKPPALQVAMKVRVPAVTETVTKRRRPNRRVTNWDECGCTDAGCSCADYDMFALAAALEVI